MLFEREELITVVLDAESKDLVLAERIDFLLAERNTPFSHLYYINRVIGGGKPPCTIFCRGGHSRVLSENRLSNELKKLKQGCYFLRRGEITPINSKHYEAIVSVLGVMLGVCFNKERGVFKSITFKENRRIF